VTDTQVVDASVALKWLVLEDLSDHADRLLQDSLAGAEHISAPPLLQSEITNALHQRQRRGNITAAYADRALANFLAVPLEIVEPPGLYSAALALARRYDLAATYDAQYLALAQALDADLWTADRDLLGRVPRTFRRLRFIGDYVPP
jgi:predicted nucleic acid-binding protein